MKIQPGCPDHSVIVRQVAESILRHYLDWIEDPAVSVPIAKRLFEAADLLEENRE